MLPPAPIIVLFHKTIICAVAIELCSSLFTQSYRLSRCIYDESEKQVAGGNEQIIRRKKKGFNPPTLEWIKFSSYSINNFLKEDNHDNT